MSDILINSGKVYRQHLSEAYDLVYGKNRQLHDIHVIFTPEDFHHLVGLHHCDDIHIKYK